MKYRKKPVVVEAFQFKGPINPFPNWMQLWIANGDAWYQGGSDPYLTIKTLEGEMRANYNDWIIKGVKNEIYPCKLDIFEATYEAVAQQPNTGE